MERCSFFCKSENQGKLRLLKLLPDFLRTLIKASFFYVISKLFLEETGNSSACHSGFLRAAY